MGSSLIAADQHQADLGAPGQYELSLTISPSDLKDALASRYPSLFSGRREIYFLPLKEIRESVHQCNSSAQLMYPHLGSTFSFVKNQMQEMVPSYPQLGALVSEIDHDIGISYFDLVKLFSYGFRVLGAISSEPTRDALSVFKQFNGDETDRDIRKNWNSPFSVLDVVDNKVFSSLVTYKLPLVSDRLHKLLDTETERLGRPTVTYALFGHGKLGLATLIEGFINRLYPMPITDQQQTAHGIPMTPFLFGYHDFLHAYGDEDAKDIAFDVAGNQKLSELAASRLNAEDLVLPVATYMVGKSNLIEDTMSELLDLYFTYYLPSRSMADVKKALVGFFLMAHEDFDVTSDVFGMANLDDILKIFLGEATVVDDQGDVLMTDPVTGKTSLTAEQALDAILASGLPCKEQERYYSEDIAFKRADLDGKKYRIDLKQEPMITTVKVIIQGGFEYTWEIETLKYDLASASDDVGLLKIAGIKMTPPSDTELQSENGRQVALNYLYQVSTNLDLCRQAFKESSSELLFVVPMGKNKYLWQSFWNKSKKLEKNLARAVAHID